MSVLARKYQQQPQVETKKRIVRVRSKITLGEKLIMLIMAIAFFLVLSYIIHTYASIYVTNREIYQLEAEIGKQIQKNEGLALQVTELSAPERILNIAYEKLGMTLDDNKVKVIQN